MSAGARSKGDVHVHSIRQNGKRGKLRPTDGYVTLFPRGLGD